MTDRPALSPSRSIQTLSVLDAALLRVESGANTGDPLSFADDLQPEDIYHLVPGAAPRSLRIHLSERPPFVIARDSRTGHPGASLHLDSCLTFMSPDGRTAEGLVLVETDGAGNAVATYLMPLADMAPRTDHVLIGIDRDKAMQRFAQVACASFTGGTRITLSSGAQVPVETLRPGDRVLTRDDGPQPIRWIGRHTVRACGVFAPIRIRAGTLNNTGDLVVSPDHRLFVYQRSDAMGIGRAELLVRARHLENGDSIQRVSGGHVDYYQMLFDRHQILYAEGIAAESTLLNDAATALLPGDAQVDLAALLPVHRRDALPGVELSRSQVSRPDAAETLRRASTR